MDSTGGSNKNEPFNMGAKLKIPLSQLLFYTITLLNLNIISIIVSRRRVPRCAHTQDNKTKLINYSAINSEQVSHQ